MVLHRSLIFIVLLLTGCNQKNSFQNIRYVPKLKFTSKEITRVSIDSVYSYSLSLSVSTPVAISVDIPSWLTYDADHHVISGRPAAAGQYPVHIRANNADTTVHQYFMLTVFNDETTNILALGNSITNGTDRYNSYRRSLWQKLHTDNYNFDFVGSWSSHHMGGLVPNPDFDMDHDGHSGWTAENVLHPPDWDSARGSVTDWLKIYKPDIVLLELGTNEVFQCTTPARATTSLSLIIDALRTKNPSVKIFLAQIPPLGAEWVDKKLCGNNISYGEALLKFNAQLTIFGAGKNTAESPVVMVDQYTGVNPAVDLYDDIHPNDVGEEKMAERWFQAIKGHLHKLK